VLQPRRAYFFLRAVSFLFQNRAADLFAFVRSNPSVVARLVKHLKTQHMIQLLLNMLAVERQMVEIGAALSWSQSTELVKSVINELVADPEANFESVHKFFADIVAAYPSDGPLVKSIVTGSDGVVVRTMHQLMVNVSTADAAVKMLDAVVLPIVLKNVDDGVFYASTMALFQDGQARYVSMLSQKSLQSALAGAKLLQMFAKNKLSILIEDAIEPFVDLLFKFKWANILHEVVTTTIVAALQQQDEELSLLFLQRGKLVERLVATLVSSEATGNRGHLLLLANNLKDATVAAVVEHLASNEAWKAFVPKIDELNSQNLTFRQYEAQKHLETQRQQEQQQQQQAAQPAETKCTPLFPLTSCLPAMPHRTPCLATSIQAGEFASKRLVLTPLNSPEVTGKLVEDTPPAAG